ncbi:unnamed protein product [Owenia fusiformis]|uniref:Uncharacterized protein n=1 Tax=Owenia fusiformis TaxID=6347 RepID=A0A8J1Y3E8_OWEFU|nr:unnamed protein product [Owenia fusiformis]
MAYWARIFALFGFCISNSTCPYVDMSHELFTGLPQYPGDNPFTLKTVHRGPFLDNPFIIMYDFEMPEHSGSHIDAPYHFFESGWKVNEIPLERLVGPAVVLDIREKVNKTPSDEDTTVDIADAEAWERKYGRIPNGAIVLMNSGNGKNWPNVTAYIGTEEHGDITKLRFAGFSPELAEWLVKERNIIGIGSDALSFDRGSSYVNYSVHNIISPQNIWGLENVANLDLIPEDGATVYVMPLKIRGGSGSPARIFAKWNKRKLLKRRESRK